MDKLKNGQGRVSGSKEDGSHKALITNVGELVDFLSQYDRDYTIAVQAGEVGTLYYPYVVLNTATEKRLLIGTLSEKEIDNLPSLKIDMKDIYGLE